MTNTRSCVFCGSRPVSREHVWPEWVGQELSKLDPEPFRVTRGEAGDAKRWRSRDFKITVRRFCKTCNNEWMSVIERETAPLLKRMMLGQELTLHLSPTDQETLARWAYKTALVADFVVREPIKDKDHPAIPKTAYTDFYRDRVPPNIGCMVWTTAYGDSPHAALARRSTLPVIGVGADGKDIPGTVQLTYLATITVFRVVFQILGHLRGDWMPTKTDPERNAFLIRLWPPTGDSIVWPRNGLALSNNALDTLARRTDFA